MKTIKQKVFNVLSSATLLTFVIAPVVAIPSSSLASGGGTVTAFTVPTIPNQTSSTTLGTIMMTIPAGALSSSDSVTLSLPHGFSFNPVQVDPNVEANAASASYTVSVYQLQGSQGVVGHAQVSAIGNNVIKIQMTSPPGPYGSPGTSSPSDDIKLVVALRGIAVNGAHNGPVNVTLDGPSSSAFPTGVVTVGNVQTNGKVDLYATNTVSSNNIFSFNLNLTEETPGSLRTDSSAIRLKLPSGYVWNGLGGNYTQLYGDSMGLSITGQGTDTLYINATNLTIGQAASLMIPLTFSVNDDNQARVGPVNAYISGTSSVNVGSLQVGQYGDYSASFSSSNVPTIYAGKAQQTIGDIILRESIPGTFIPGRTILLTLPDSARWEDVFEAIQWNGGNLPPFAPSPTLNISGSNGLNATASFTGSDYRTLKLTINNSSQYSTDPGELDLRNLQIATSARASGDINVTVSGSAGVSGTIKIATAARPATMTVSDVKPVVLGQSNQPIGDIIISEAAPDVFNNDHVGSGTNSREIAVKIDATGVTWDQTPTVTVTSGDASISNVYTTTTSDNKGLLVFTLAYSSSAAPATFRISGGTITVSRMAAYGPLNFQLQGQAVDYAASQVAAWANDTTTVDSTTGATVVGGGAGTNAIASFVIGSTNYTVNGQLQKFDVAPFIDANGRTQIPIRAAAESLGALVSWDQNSQTATILKNGKAIAVKVGSNKMNVGGVYVAMDTAAIIKSGRVFVPYRAIAEALGAQVNWNAATQTVTIQ